MSGAKSLADLERAHIHPGARRRQQDAGGGDPRDFAADVADEAGKLITERMRMGQPARVGAYFFWDRELFVLEAQHSDDVSEGLVLPGPHFACLLAWDATSASDDSIVMLGRRLLRAGCVYFCCWGPDCERVHDLIDRARDEMDSGTGSVVMTTWHARESLTEVLWFLLNTASPDPAFEETCRSSIGISMASVRWAAEIRAALSDPSAFSARVLAEGEGG